jgi:hypothetical protein
MTPGIAHTIIRPGIFADAYLVTIDSVPRSSASSPGSGE